MKIKTSKLNGKVLDYVVCSCEGYKDISPLTTDGQRRLRTHNYSSNWNKAGQIIQREQICLNIGHDGVWLACIRQNYEDRADYSQVGPTPLEAAMRCYVSSKFGPEVEVPDELL